ncbi:SH3 domain-containing protein [Sphingomonas sp.]|uniref:SH3 domain-containing protein n=1 Tax=Sphingomonas sp. TaxID=28214 RepID=UPI003CC61F8D
MRLLAALLTLAVPATASVAVLAADTAPHPPYWNSIRAGEARMRTGPGRQYPASWVYRRADLPVRVVAEHREWRKVEDPDGTQGWMQTNLLSGARTALIRGAEPVTMLERPVTGARLLFRAAPGVVGRISACGNGWCRLDVKGRAGFVQVGSLWGVEAAETLP